MMASKAESREPRALTLQTVAGLLSISKRTLHRLIAAGEFPAPIKVGASSRVLTADLDRYLDRQRRKGGG